MKIPDLPEDEKARLKTLKSLNILDTPREVHFDHLTRMAKRLFDVPIALVSLVDENRQWFKSCIGLDVRETPREISFCGHAILDENIFVIEDASKDDRFYDNPLVVNEPNIRFYAGAQLRALNGSKLGTLCIIDTRPRQLSDEDIQSLEDLVSLAEREIAALEIALLDDLTQISNRRGFLASAQQSIELSIRQKTPAALIFFDLDGFKKINDEYGHAEGDQALIAFANHLKQSLRDSDLVARFGGDEFIALLIDTTKYKAEELVARLLTALNKYNKDAGLHYEISFSYGIVGFDSTQHKTVEAMLAEGDSVMYTNKHS